MRCPKCRYISFERAERCRNCGYDFSLASQAVEPELPMRDPAGEPVGPLADLALDEQAPAIVAEVEGSGTDGFDRARPPGRITDLPLFGPTSVPRAPLAVRRSATSEATRESQPRRNAPRLGLDPPASAAARAADGGLGDSVDGLPASAPRRLAAGVIDGAIVLATDLGVLYFTLQLCGLGFADALVIPAVPFVGFLLLLNGGYLAAFTAVSGQTIGKMAAGIKVVGIPGTEADGGSRVSVGFATLRTVAYLASALPAGLGFVPAFVGRDRRALHDRLAETQVVRVL
jgi:uncharacterized RDD family membrane protein YckC